MSTTKRLQKLFSWVHRDDNPNDQAHSIDKALPTFDELPSFQNFKGCAWDVWGKDDQLGTVNLLTPDVVKRASAEEILTGKSVSLNWPVNLPSKPLFGRKVPEINMKPRGEVAIRDDELHIVRRWASDTKTRVS